MKFGTVVAIDSLSKPTDFGFNRSRVRVRVRIRFVACGSKIMPECGGYHITFRFFNIKHSPPLT